MNQVMLTFLHQLIVFVDHVFSPLFRCFIFSKNFVFVSLPYLAAFFSFSFHLAIYLTLLTLSRTRQTSGNNLTRPWIINTTLNLISHKNQSNDSSQINQSWALDSHLSLNFNLTAIQAKKDNHQTQQLNSADLLVNNSLLNANNFTLNSQTSIQLSGHLNGTKIESEFELVSNFSLNNDNLSSELSKLRNESDDQTLCGKLIYQAENVSNDCLQFLKVNLKHNLQDHNFSTSSLDTMPDGDHLNQSSEYRLVTNDTVGDRQNDIYSFQTKQNSLSFVNQSIINNVQQASNQTQANITVSTPLRENNESTEPQLNLILSNITLLVSKKISITFNIILN
jgi:hypothetical protein